MVRAARKLPVPFAVGDVVTARVEALPLGPDAVARANGFVIFVAGAIPGEDVRVKVTEVNRRFGRGEIVSVVARSPDRAMPFCPVYLKCGGCHLQHISDTARREAKRRLLARTISHALGRDVPVAPFDPAPDRGYRDKVAIVTAPLRGGGIAAGFYKAHSHELVTIADCPVQRPEATKLALAAVQALREVGAVAYDEDRLTGDVRHVVVRAGEETGDLYLIIVVARAEKPRWIDAALQKLKALGPTGIAINVSPRREREMVLGDETHVLDGPPRYRTRIEGITYRVAPTSFFQTSAHGARSIVRTVARMLDPIKGRRVFDVYGGAGLIGLALAKRGARAIIIEGNPASIADARATSEAENIKIAARRGRAEDVVPRLLAQGTRAQDVVVDPPREGCHPRLIQALGRLEPERVVYVSCDPESLARDLAALEAQHFITTEVVPIDMFPHAYHVEAVASLRRRA